MNAVLSQVNDCPYGSDMLVSLVHATLQSLLFTNRRMRYSTPLPAQSAAFPPSMAWSGTPLRLAALFFGVAARSHSFGTHQTKEVSR